MSTAYKARLQKLKCAVVIRSNGKILPFDGACELDAGADQAACRHFLHDLQWADVLGKADLFRNTAFFSISSSDQELNECPAFTLSPNGVTKYSRLIPHLSFPLHQFIHHHHD